MLPKTDCDGDLYCGNSYVSHDSESILKHEFISSLVLIENDSVPEIHASVTACMTENGPEIRKVTAG